VQDRLRGRLGPEGRVRLGCREQPGKVHMWAYSGCIRASGTSLKDAYMLAVRFGRHGVGGRWREGRHAGSKGAERIPESMHQTLLHPSPTTYTLCWWACFSHLWCREQRRAKISVGLHWNQRKNVATYGCRCSVQETHNGTGDGATSGPCAAANCRGSVMGTNQNWGSARR